MSRHRDHVVVVIVVLLWLGGCGGDQRRDPTTPTEDVVGCPSETAPERCLDLAQAAASAGHGDLAWAYTALACGSPSGAQCTTMWQRFAKLAPTQTDALNVLHVACDHVAAACEQLAVWHVERGHPLAAAAYRKRVDASRSTTTAPSRGSNALALATDLAAIAHVADAPPRTAAIDQMIGRQLTTPSARAVATAKAAVRKAWPMHAATQGASSDACASTAQLDRHPVPLQQCLIEVRPFDADQIAVLNRCGQAVSVAYAGARADRSTYVKQVRLEANEARSAGISHGELGPLTYAVCAGECRVTSSPDDVTASWTGKDATYYCSRGGAP
jgi:hypothetical protein